MVGPKAKIILRRVKLVTLLEQGPMSRRNIIRHFPKRKEKTIDNDLKALVMKRQLKLHRVQLEKSPRDAYVYSVPSSSEKAINHAIQSVYDSIEHVVDPAILGTMAQFYIRDATIELKRRGQSRFSNIPTETTRGTNGKQRLGHIPLAEPKRAMKPGEQETPEFADFIVSYTIPNHEPFKLLYQIKNRFDEVMLEDVLELVGQALRNKMQPVLIANRISDKAKTFCEEFGIVILELNRQLVPRRIQAQTKRLKAYPEEALERFQFVTQQPFRLRKGRNTQIDRRSLHDLEVMSDPDWIEKPRRIWLGRQHELQAHPVLSKLL